MVEGELDKLADRLNRRLDAEDTPAPRLPALMREVIEALAELSREVDSFPGYPGRRGDDQAKIIALRNALESRLEQLTESSEEKGGKG